MKNLTTVQEYKPRVVLLYRASTKKQTDVENDIPLQRNILRPWADLQGKFVREFVEGGISGFKISASKRDSIIEIKAMADRQEFDVLGIYMSDRLGRIADETPLIVSYLNSHGIKVISFCEGEISSKTHTDKLLTYIRYWQAEGESLKTSRRVTDAGEEKVRQGKWRAGNPPYGYKTVSNGTLNFKGRPILDVVIDPETSAIVKEIFRLYKEHYGIKGIAKYLNDRNILAYKRGMWAHRQILNILKNKLYIGIYELGKTSEVRMRSPIMEHLRIVSEQVFFEVQELLEKNSNCRAGQRPTIRGSRLLTGLLFCECGRKFTSQTYRCSKQRMSGKIWHYEQSVYRCGAYRFPKEGQCNKKPYNAERLENLITDDAKKFISELDIASLMYSQKEILHDQERIKNEQLNKIVQKKAQKEKDLYELKEKICQIILGKMRFSEELLSELIEMKQAELNDLCVKHEETQIAVSELTSALAKHSVFTDGFESWIDRFDMQDTMGKKTMLINIIDKIVVMDDNITIAYKINLTNLCDAEILMPLEQRGERGKIQIII